MISSKTDMVHELPHQFPNNLKLRIQGNQEILEKSQIRMTAFSQSVFLPEIKLRQQNLKKTQKQISFSCPIRFCWISLFYSKYFAQDCIYFSKLKQEPKCELSISEKYSNLGQSKTNSKVFFIVTKSLNLEKFQNFLNINP